MDKKLTLGNVFDAIMCVENDVKREGKDLKAIEKVTRESAQFSIEIIDGLNRKEDFNSIMNNAIFDFYSRHVEENNDSFIVRFLEKLELIEKVKNSFENQSYWLNGVFVERKCKEVNDYDN